MYLPLGFKRLSMTNASLLRWFRETSLKSTDVSSKLLMHSIVHQSFHLSLPFIARAYARYVIHENITPTVVSSLGKRLFDLRPKLIYVILLFAELVP